MALEDELDRLYGLPLDEFVRERNALSSRLRKDGDRDAAEQVKGLPKPSVVAWTVNRLARTDEVPLRALLKAADELRAAQRKALGRSGGDALRGAMRAERDALARLRRAAERELAAAGHAAAPATLERIASTLRAAAADEDGRELLRRGRLTAELEAGGFDALAGMPLAVGSAGKTEGRKPAQAQHDRAAQRRAVAAARERVRVLQRRSRELRREADRAERELAEATRKAERARTDADRAAAALAEAEAELRTAQS